MNKYPEPESTTLELKRELPKNDQIVKTIIGFCNLYGGRLIIGVDDDRTIRGLPEEQIEQLMENLHQTIIASCSPPIIPHIYSQRFDSKLVLNIEVSSGMNKPYFKTSLGIAKGTYLRVGRSTITVDSELLEDLKWRSRGRSPDEYPIYRATPTDLDKEKVQEFFSAKKSGAISKIKDDLLYAYKLLIKDQNITYPTTAGILLFGADPEQYFPESFIIATHFKGIESREAIDSLDCTGTIFEQYESALQYVIKRLGVAYKITSSKRTEKLEIPAVAIREILVNALVHRDYSIKGPIKIAIFDNRIEIFSPGIFPGPFSIEQLRTGITYIRNTIIARIMREAGYVEKLGSGFNALFKSYEKAKLATPSIIEGDNFVKCILPRTRKNGSSKEDIIDKLLMINNFLTIEDLQRESNLSRASAGRQLKEWVEKKMLKREGKGRATRYIRQK
jgi:ATP-dependent DNA helicase RecG